MDAQHHQLRAREAGQHLAWHRRDLLQQWRIRGRLVRGSVGVDAAGNIYASGFRNQTNFPTLNALFPTTNGSSDCWIAKFGEIVIVTPSPSVLTASGGANHKHVPATLSYADGPSAHVWEQGRVGCFPPSVRLLTF